MRRLYQPGERGFEREIAKRLEYWEKLRARRAESEPPAPKPGAAKG